MRSFLFKPVDIAPLVFFRIVAGALITIEICGEAVTDYGQAYVEPSFHFTYLFFDWVRPWAPAGIYLHFAFNIAMGVLVTIGWGYRLAAFLWFVGQLSMFLMESSIYINHIYLYWMVSLLLVFLPCHRALSVDATRDPSIRTTSAPAWCLYLLRFQIAVVYIFAGLAKLHNDWLLALPLKTGLQMKAHYPLIGGLLAADWLAYALSWGGVLFDLLVVPGLLWKRTRRLAFTAAVFFHMSNVVVFGLGTFPWFSLAATALFFDPAMFRRLPFLRTRLDPYNDYGAAREVGTHPRLTIAALALWVAVQLVVPLRPYRFAGSPSWTERGHLFSWRMMLRAKTGSVAYTVTEPGSGRQWRESPRDYLTPLQYRKMIGKPDLLIQFAHFLAEDYERRGHADVEVRVRAYVSLNGRKLQLFVDPALDLAAETRGGPYEWIKALSP